LTDPTQFARFALAVPLYRQFDYSVPAGLPLRPGTRYRLPFGSGQKIGILVSAIDSSEVSPDRIKPIIECLDDDSLLDSNLFELALWMADYYVQPQGDVLFQLMPSALRRGRTAQYQPATFWVSNFISADLQSSLQRRSPRQFELYSAIEQSENGLDALELKSQFTGWHGRVKKLLSKNAITAVQGQNRSVDTSAIWPTLNSQQFQIADSISSQLKGFSVHLIDGITGSGKTEVYFKLIQACLSEGRQVIYLVPEIGLTPQLVDRVNSRFGNRFVISHSGLTDIQRYHAWETFRHGDADIMMGTRSCLFSVSDKLGLIIIDEEHDHSYRQEDGVRYHARDIAVKRAQMLDIPIVLGSATPSLESLNNCQRDHFQHHLLTLRPTTHPPPAIELVDIKHQPLNAGCSPYTLNLMRSHLLKGGQVLVYLNRRGFAPVVMCHECGWQAECRHCDSRLTLHQSLNRLICHHCGYGMPSPSVCPECQHDQVNHYGIGTEQLEQSLKHEFEDIPILRIDRDTIRHRDHLAARLASLNKGEPCILIGTQMIAKGHDYPSITLSVMLDGDQALYSSFYRATEQLAQTVYQVAGRAGRGTVLGQALLQTRFPEHPTMRDLQSSSYREIVDGIMLEREKLAFPPYSRVVLFRADAFSLDEALKKLNEIKQKLLEIGKPSLVKCIGPMPTLMTRRIGRYRAQLALISLDPKILRRYLRQAKPVFESTASNAKVKWFVDVDPYDL
jgi:primosomal protein N' (replication factor Y) (superfamily II helicase)